MEVVINLRDVTSRVESDRALQESQERYRAIVETAQERIWVADPQGRTVYVNQKMADIADRSTEELYFRGILELLDVDDSTMLSRRLLERRTAGTEEYELHLRHLAAGVRLLCQLGGRLKPAALPGETVARCPNPGVSGIVGWP